MEYHGKPVKLLLQLFFQGNQNVILSPDEYTLTVQSKRGPRDFTFDQVSLFTVLFVAISKHDYY